MTIKITQVCDRCKRERPLDARPTENQVSVKHTDAGWRPLFDDNSKHLCPSCIRVITEELK